MWWHCRCTGVRLMYTSVISIAVAFVLALVAPAHAGAPTDALKGHVDQVVKILSDPLLRDRPEVRRAKVRKIAEDIFDYPDTARRALGPHWNARTPEQRQEFVKLFSEILDRSYGSKIELYQGERVQYVGETIDGSEATVIARAAAAGQGDGRAGGQPGAFADRSVSYQRGSSASSESSESSEPFQSVHPRGSAFGLVQAGLASITAPVDDQAEGRRTGDVVPVEDEPIAKDVAISAHDPPTPQYRGHRSRVHGSWEKHFRYRTGTTMVYNGRPWSSKESPCSSSRTMKTPAR